MGIVDTAMPIGQGQNLRVAPKDDLAGAGRREAGFGRPDLDAGGIPELDADGQGVGCFNAEAGCFGGMLPAEILPRRGVMPVSEDRWRRLEGAGSVALLAAEYFVAPAADAAGPVRRAIKPAVPVARALMAPVGFTGAAGGTAAVKTEAAAGRATVRAGALMFAKGVAQAFENRRTGALLGWGTEERGMSEFRLEREVGLELEGKDEPVPDEALELDDVVARSCWAFHVLLVIRDCGRSLG